MKRPILSGLLTMLLACVLSIQAGAMTSGLKIVKTTPPATSSYPDLNTFEVTFNMPMQNAKPTTTYGGNQYVGGKINTTVYVKYYVSVKEDDPNTLVFTNGGSVAGGNDNLPMTDGISYVVCLGANLKSADGTYKCSMTDELTFAYDASAPGPDTTPKFTVSLSPDPSEPIEAEEWPLIKLGPFASQPTGPDHVTVTDQAGRNHDVEVNYAWWGMFDENILLKFNTCESMQKSGFYTVDIPAGTFTLADGSVNSAVKGTYSYVNADKPADNNIHILSADFVKADGTVIDLTTNASLVDSYSGISREDKFVVNTDANASVGFATLTVTYTGTDAETGQSATQTLAYHQTKKKDSNGAILFEVVGVEEFAQGTEYTFTFSLYDTEYPANYPETTRTLLGEAAYKAVGIGSQYVFSPVKLVSVTPENGTEITDATAPIVVKFSGPADIVLTEAGAVKSGVNLGQHSMEAFESATPNADGSEWSLKVRESYIKNLKHSLNVIVFAKDKDGLVVEGTSGHKETSCFAFNWECYLGIPPVILTPAPGEVEELYTFKAQVPNLLHPIALGSGADKPMLYKEEGGRPIAEVDMASEVLCDADGTPLSGTINDAKSFIVTFNLNKAITEPGTYILRCPFAAFQLGTELSGFSSKATDYVYTVAAAPEVAGCSLAEGETAPKLSLVSFYLTRDAEATAPTAAMELLDGNGVVASAPLFIAKSAAGKTMVVADFAGTALEAGKAYTVSVAAGLLALPGTETYYPAMTATVAGGGNAEHVSLSHKVAGHSVTATKVAKGHSVKVDVTPAADWEVETVTFNGADVTADVADNSYTTPALEGDSEIEVAMAYAGKVMFDFTTSVAPIEGCAYTVANDGDVIVVNGLANGNNVKLYSDAGHLLANREAAAGQLRISAANGIYIIVITDANGKSTALKVRH